jgi:hypothetical protein
MPLFVILVSGRPEAGDDGFARCAWLRVAELVQQFFKNRKKSGAVIGPSDVLRFIHFDCHSASVGIYEHDFASMKGAVRDRLAKSVQSNWQTLDATFQTAFGVLAQQEDPKNFVEWSQIDTAKASDAEHAVSMVNVYHSVRKAPAGSVLELSIFSHAFVDGPVLTNTFANPGLTRTPGDTDGRAAIDFQPNMGETGAANANALDEFKAAFASTGSFRIWGCNIQDVVDTTPPGGGPNTRCLIMSTVREVVEEAFVHQLRAGGPIAKLLRDDKHLPPGATMVDVDMDRQITHEIELQTDPGAGHGLTPFTKDRLFEIRYDGVFTNHSYHEFFQGEKNGTDFAKTIKRSFSDVVKFVAAETVGSYFFIAAQALKTVTVIGGAPGTSAELDDLGQQTIGEARLWEARFFSKFFGVSITESGVDVQRHYAILDNQGTAVKTILDRQANGLP